MKVTSIQGKIGLLLLAFFTLVAISAGATFWGIESQEKDALVINLAGRQRMLTQQMTRLALEIEKGSNGEKKALLQEAASAFEVTLAALREGGAAPYLPGRTVDLPPTRQEGLLAQLGRVNETWESYRASLEIILGSQPGDEAFTTALMNLENLSPLLAAEADATVRLYEAAASQKVSRLRWVQAGFLTGALVLLVAGGLLIRRSVIYPMRSLGAAAQRMGSGDLSTPLHVRGPDEVNLLAETLEMMRARLETSQEKLRTWGVQLEERVRQRTAELEALQQVSREISSRLDIREVLWSVTDKARGLLGAEVAFLCLLDDEGQSLTLHAASGPQGAVARSSTQASGGLTGMILASPEAQPCNVEGCLGACGIITGPYQASHLAAPLRLGEKVIGALCVGSAQAGAFPDEARSLLTKLANTATIALENARLYASAERLGILEERQRLAAEMHDGLAQTMSYIGLKINQALDHLKREQMLDAVSVLEEAERGLDQGLEDIRRAIDSLQDDIPLRFTLQDQLARLVGEFNQDEAPITLQSTVRSPLLLPRDKSEQIVRITREALLNAVRHARASQITLRFEQLGEKMVLTVEDDGVGFALQTTELDSNRHFGIKIMHARTARLGGELQIHTSPGIGTRLSLAWPCETVEKAPGS